MVREQLQQLAHVLGGRARRDGHIGRGQRVAQQVQGARGVRALVERQDVLRDERGRRRARREVGGGDGEHVGDGRGLEQPGGALRARQARAQGGVRGAQLVRARGEEREVAEVGAVGRRWVGLSGDGERGGDGGEGGREKVGEHLVRQGEVVEMWQGFQCWKAVLVEMGIDGGERAAGLYDEREAGRGGQQSEEVG